MIEIDQELQEEHENDSETEIETPLNMYETPPNTHKGGRRKHDVWQFLNNEVNACQSTYSSCKHCHLNINHLKKSQVVINHLLQCTNFRCYLQRSHYTSDDETLSWFYESNKGNKKRSFLSASERFNSPSPSQKSPKITSFMVPPLPNNDKKK